MEIFGSVSTHSASQAGRSSRRKPLNPIEIAIRSWLGVLPHESFSGVDSYLERLLSRAPKRWVVYFPMVLFPSGSFGTEWWEAVGSEQAASKYAVKLWNLLLENIGKREGKGLLTHLAVNSGIPLHNPPSQGPGSVGLGLLANEEDFRNDLPIPNFDGDRVLDKMENVLRTPSGLIMLHGEFGPSLSPKTVPAEKDFKEAFWVSTKQNGITQIWAPRYTMFSRGNIKEKARLLDFHRLDQTLESRRITKEELANNSAVDLYAGIGYFIFSYVKMGLGKVVGWELNPWSVEGLRRGAVANGWSVKVARGNDVLDLVDAQIVVVLGDNRNAASRLQGPCRYNIGAVRHVNCGLLPSSEDSWKMALEILDGDGWLHLHENVGTNDVHARTVEIEELIRCWLKKSAEQRSAKVEYVEFVKTFAPGVWHCVFDVYISSAGSRS